MSSVEATGSDPIDPSMFVTLRMNLVVHVDPALAPDAEQAIQTCLDTLHALGAIVTPTQTDLPPPKIASVQSSELDNPSPTWQEALKENRLRCQARYDLSNREVEVLKLAAEGLPNAEIATRLIISKHTVKSHLQRAGHKFGTGDRRRMIGLFNGTIMPDTEPDHS